MNVNELKNALQNQAKAFYANDPYSAPNQVIRALGDLCSREALDWILIGREEGAWILEIVGLGNLVVKSVPGPWAGSYKAEIN